LTVLNGTDFQSTLFDRTVPVRSDMSIRWAFADWNGDGIIDAFAIDPYDVVLRMTVLDGAAGLQQFAVTKQNPIVEINSLETIMPSDGQEFFDYSVADTDLNGNQDGTLDLIVIDKALQDGAPSVRVHILSGAITEMSDGLPFHVFVLQTDTPVGSVQVWKNLAKAAVLRTFGNALTLAVGGFYYQNNRTGDHGDPEISTAIWHAKSFKSSKSGGTNYKLLNCDHEDIYVTVSPSIADLRHYVTQTYLAKTQQAAYFFVPDGSVWNLAITAQGNGQDFPDLLPGDKNFFDWTFLWPFPDSDILHDGVACPTGY